MEITLPLIVSPCIAFPSEIHKLNRFQNELPNQSLTFSGVLDFQAMTQTYGGKLIGRFAFRDGQVAIWMQKGLVCFLHIT